MPGVETQLVIVGSMGLDTIHTVSATRERQLGGSVSYAAPAASYYTSTGMVGVVGNDFPKAFMDLFTGMGIDRRGVQVADGKTFFWEGRYHENMDHRDTLATELNVFASFEPSLPEDYARAPLVLLGNISPSLQLHVLDQVRQPRFVLADTMNLWIETTRADLLRVLKRVDMLTLNESEARMLTGRHSLPDAADAIRALGPPAVLIKKGEHGCMLFTPDRTCLLPAYPVRQVVDPTGAGDSFAGGFMGRLAETQRLDHDAFADALVHGTVVASFNVGGFSLEGFRGVDRDAIHARVAQYRAMLPGFL